MKHLLACNLGVKKLKAHLLQLMAETTACDACIQCSLSQLIHTQDPDADDFRESNSPCRCGAHTKHVRRKMVGLSFSDVSEWSVESSMTETQREVQFISHGWITLIRRCALVLNEFRFFKQQIVPTVALLMATGILGVALAGFVALTTPLTRSPVMPMDFPYWFQIDAAPFAFTVAYCGLCWMILLVAANVTGELDTLDPVRSMLLKATEPAVAWRLTSIMKEGKADSAAQKTRSTFLQLDYLLEQLQDKEGQIFSFTALGRVTPVKAARLGYVFVLPALFLLQAWATDKVKGTS